MKKTLTIMSLVLVFMMMFTVNAFATNTDIEFIENPNTEVKENIGWLHITIDTETNRPADFQNYNFFVNVVNEETGEWNLIDVLYINDYTARAELPYGKYYVAEAGVKNDVTYKFGLVTGQKFELNADVHTAGVDLGFPVQEVVDTPVQTPDVETPVVDDIPEKNAKTMTLMFDYLSQPVDGAVQVNLIKEDNGAKFTITLSQDNQYVSTMTLPVGTYVIDEDKSVVEGQDNKTVTTNNALIVTEDGECVAEIQLKDRTGATDSTNPDDTQDPSVQEPTEEVKKTNNRLTLIIASGLVLLVVIVIAAVQVKKYWNL